jgi:hypothetical protein
MRWNLLSDEERQYLDGCSHVHFNVYNESVVDFSVAEEENTGLDEPFCRVKGIDFQYCPADRKGEWKVQGSLQMHDLAGTVAFEITL